ncbi:MAG: tRNA (guanosine(37)-N1)-methyltransferase TrmD [Lachnospiraceae bacterium]|nr:tRNA (guanosine(37)-N1)-methyltransferase TrmD [uncultured Acetatifactor sp.]MCI9219622.1 tRNA (guanosine(37)-N1)-methyltransferase TrmD [Lachnospiraceae bacterium]
MAKFHILTLFPDMIEQGLSPSIIGRAARRGILCLHAVDIRDYTRDKHKKVDDYPYGGGAGMLMQAQPVYDAHRAVTEGRPVRTVYVTPQGMPFTQRMAEEFAKEEELVFLCGHYEGIDERVLEKIVTDQVSIGDYVLTGGELAAMVMIDAIARLIPGVLGNDSSAGEESFYNDLLEYPQYSRPEEWQGMQVPGVLLSGNHRQVAAWRLEQSRQRTADRRPDLYEKYQKKQCLIQRLSGEKRNNIHMMESLSRGRADILYTDFRGRDTAVLLYDRKAGICMMTALDRETGERMAELIPGDTQMLLVSEPFLRDILLKAGYALFGEFGQFLYTRKETLPVKHREIRTLSEGDIGYVSKWYGTEGPGLDDEYVRERISAGAMYGAFLEGRQVGFVGIHDEGSLGMLFVEESFRGRGIGASLEAWAVNCMLEKGWIPYGHVAEGNEASARLQERLGFYKAEKSFWWLEKVLAKDT